MSFFPSRLFQAESPSTTRMFIAKQKCLTAWGHIAGGRCACESSALAPSTTVHTALSAVAFVSEARGIGDSRIHPRDLAAAMS